MRPSKKTWIVVADASRARCCSVDHTEGKLTLTREVDHDVAIGAGRDLASDRPGRSYDSRGAGRHGMEPSTDPRANEKHHFLRGLAKDLHRHLDRDAVDAIVLVAAPGALGILRQELSAAVRHRVVKEIAKDLTSLKDHELARHLKLDLEGTI